MTINLYESALAVLTVGGGYWAYCFGHWRGRAERAGARQRAWERGHRAGTTQCVELLALSDDPSVRSVAAEISGYLSPAPAPSKLTESSIDNAGTERHN